MVHLGEEDGAGGTDDEGGPQRYGVRQSVRASENAIHCVCFFAVVNCVQAHPVDCCVATSGIDDTIKVKRSLPLGEFGTAGG